MEVVSDPKKPDWDSFETYKGPEEKESGLAGTLLHWTMILVLLVIVFAICGAIAWYLPYAFIMDGRGGGGLRSYLAYKDTAAFSWIRFGIGGVIGAGWVIRALYGKRKSPFV